MVGGPGDLWVKGRIWVSACEWLVTSVFVCVKVGGQASDYGWEGNVGGWPVEGRWRSWVGD